MTISRISLAVLAAALVALGARAQTGDSDQATAPPRTLGQPLPPVEAPNEPPAPQPDQPPATSDGGRDVDTSGLKSDVPEAAPGSKAAAPEAQPLPLPEPPKPTVQVETLGTVEGPAEGLLDPSNGGMDQNIWTGSGRADIETLLPHIPLA